MSSDSRPPQQEPYLSTEDIVSRVRAAQGKSRLFAFRGAFVVAGCVLLVVALVFNLRRINAPDKTKQGVAESSSEQVSPPPPAPSDTSSVTPAPQHSQRAAVLRVLVKGRAGIISLDGKRMTVDRTWSAPVTSGRHVVGVRCGSVCLKRTIMMQGAPVTLSFDCAARRVEQKT